MPAARNGSSDAIPSFRARAHPAERGPREKASESIRLRDLASRDRRPS